MAFLRYYFLPASSFQRKECTSKDAIPKLCNPPSSSMTATTVINESIVRAAVIIYIQENGFTDEQVKAEMYEQMVCSFQWMPELVAALQYYTMRFFIDCRKKRNFRQPSGIIAANCL